MAFITPSDWVLMYNPKTLGDLCSTTGVSVPDLTNNAEALFFLDAASGELAAACLVSKLYEMEDLTNIATVPGPSQNYFKRVVGQIALRLAMENRPEKYAKQIQSLREVCEATLEQLRQGKRLFVNPVNPEWQADGGVPACSGMSTWKIVNRNSLPNRTRNFYPDAAQRQPLNRQGF
ncbi:MAG: hypothetical protein ACLP9L_04825 [Thermoguttaceae bacterium]